MNEQKCKKVKVSPEEFDENLKIPVKLVYTQTIFNSDKYKNNKTYQYYATYLTKEPSDDVKYGYYRNRIFQLYQQGYTCGYITQKLIEENPNDEEIKGDKNTLVACMGKLLQYWFVWYSNPKRIRDYYRIAGVKITPDIEVYLSYYETHGELEYTKKYGVPRRVLRFIGIRSNTQEPGNKGSLFEPFKSNNTQESTQNIINDYTIMNNIDLFNKVKNKLKILNYIDTNKNVIVGRLKERQNKLYREVVSALSNNATNNTDVLVKEIKQIDDSIKKLEE